MEKNIVTIQRMIIWTLTRQKIPESFCGSGGLIFSLQLVGHASQRDNGITLRSVAYLVAKLGSLTHYTAKLGSLTH